MTEKTPIETGPQLIEDARAKLGVHLRNCQACRIPLAPLCKKGWQLVTALRELAEPTK